MLLYVDPGIGLLVLQAIIAALATAWLYFRKGLGFLFFWRRFLRKDSPSENESTGA